MLSANYVVHTCVLSCGCSLLFLIAIVWYENEQLIPISRSLRAGAMNNGMWLVAASVTQNVLDHVLSPRKLPLTEVFPLLETTRVS